MKNHILKSHINTLATKNLESDLEYREYCNEEFKFDRLDNKLKPKEKPVEAKKKLTSCDETTSVIRITREVDENVGAWHGLLETPNPNLPGGIFKKPVTIVDATVKRKRIDDPNARVGRKKRVHATDIVSTALNVTTAEFSKDDKILLHSDLLNRNSDSFIQEVHKKSRISGLTMMRPDEAAEVIVKNNLPAYAYRNLIRAQNQKGTKLFPGYNKTVAARNKFLDSATIENFEVTNLLLNIKKQGANTADQELRPVVYTKDLSNYFLKILYEELSLLGDLRTLTDGSKLIEVALSGDSGGDSMKHTFSILNHLDGKIRQHVLLIYEAADSYSNSNKCYSMIRDQIKAMHHIKYKIGEQEYTVKLYGVYDLSEQDTILGKQNSSATYPCAKCNVTKNHLQNHANVPHSIENCSDAMEAKTMISIIRWSEI